MLTFPAINPIALQIGPLTIHWYGLMYLIGFALAWWLGRQRLSQIGISAKAFEDLLFYGILGVIVGGRLGYVLFYHPVFYLNNPLDIIKIWDGGMAFHGGFLGVLVVMFAFARRQGLSFWQVSDFIAPLVPLGLALGRLGNFINGELWGRVSTLPWAMVFPHSDGLPRHPSQLYQMALEGVLLFAVLWLYANRSRPMGRVSGLFLMGYGLLRFLVEYTREPDAHLGLLTLNLSMGQWLSLPMLAVGLYLWLRPSAQR